MKVSHLDHLVLTVKDIEVTCSFYQQVLGMEVVLDNGRKALAFGSQKIKLHQQGKELEPKAHLPTSGAGDLCFITDSPLSEVIQHLRTCGVVILEGPIERLGATGTIVSLYFRDPDLNLIEVSNYR